MITKITAFNRLMEQSQGILTKLAALILCTLKHARGEELPNKKVIDAARATSHLRFLQD